MLPFTIWLEKVLLVEDWGQTDHMIIIANDNPNPWLSIPEEL